MAVPQRLSGYGDPMDFRPGINKTVALNVERATGQARDAGYLPFVLPSEGVEDRASFFDAARAVLPMNPPLLGSRSWEALSDSLAEALYDHAEKRFVIIWPNAHVMQARDPAAYELALSAFQDVADDLADPTTTKGAPKDLCVVVSEALCPF